jgi:hypothetical protein
MMSYFSLFGIEVQNSPTGFCASMAPGQLDLARGGEPPSARSRAHCGIADSRLAFRQFSKQHVPDVCGHRATSAFHHSVARLRDCSTGRGTKTRRNFSGFGGEF